MDIHKSNFFLLIKRNASVINVLKTNGNIKIKNSAFQIYDKNTKKEIYVQQKRL